MKNPEEILKMIEEIIQFIGDDPGREGLKETPHRVIRSWQELFSGYNPENRPKLKLFQRDSSCNEIVCVKSIEMYSTCEHHLLPFVGEAHIGYLPGEHIIGLSKLARVVDYFARRLQVQERLTDQITDYIMDNGGARGCGCIIEARHFCMCSRGVNKQSSKMVTNSLKGCFLEHDLKAEFLKVIYG